MLNCSLFIHALAKWLDITSFDAEMIALCLDGKATLMSLTIILINTLEAGSHRPALARFYGTKYYSIRHRESPSPAVMCLDHIEDYGLEFSAR